MYNLYCILFVTIMTIITDYVAVGSIIAYIAFPIFVRLTIEPSAEVTTESLNNNSEIIPVISIPEDI